jgi:pterin-4a-carbinolamine dehydratase
VSTHSAGGVTALDFELAAAIDSAAKDLFGS